MSLAHKLARGAGIAPTALGGPTVVEQLFGGLVQTQSESGEHVTVSRATTLPAVFRAIRLLSEPTGALPLITYHVTKDGRERANDHPAYELLHEQPNTGLTAVEFWTMLFNHFASWGRMFIGKEFVGGRLVALHAIEPDRMTVERLSNGRLEFKESLRTGGTRRWTQRDLIYIRLFTVDGVNGVSPIGLQRESLGLGLAMRKHGARFFRDFAIPPGFLKVKEEIKDSEVRERLRREFIARVRGNREIGLLDNGAEFETVGIPIKDLQFLELWGASNGDIADIFNLPRSLLGAPVGDSNTYGNRESDVVSFMKFTLHNPLRKVEQALALDRDLFPRPTGRRTHYCEFLREDLLRPDSRARAEFYRLALDPKFGWMERDEVRERENLPANVTPPTTPPTTTEEQ